jgi:hypothetical protein
MIYPTIHLNGTAASDLYDQYAAVADSLRESIRIMRENGPNARDYYVNPKHGAFQLAVEEHTARVQALLVVLFDVESILAHISDSQDSHKSSSPAA